MCPGAWVSLSFSVGMSVVRALLLCTAVHAADYPISELSSVRELMIGADPNDVVPALDAAVEKLEKAHKEIHDRIQLIRTSSQPKAGGYWGKTALPPSPPEVEETRATPSRLHSCWRSVRMRCTTLCCRIAAALAGCCVHRAAAAPHACANTASRSAAGAASSACGAVNSHNNFYRGSSHVACLMRRAKSSRFSTTAEHG